MVGLTFMVLRFRLSWGNVNDLILTIWLCLEFGRFEFEVCSIPRLFEESKPFRHNHGQEVAFKFSIM